MKLHKSDNLTDRKHFVIVPPNPVPVACPTRLFPEEEKAMTLLPTSLQAVLRALFVVTLMTVSQAAFAADAGPTTTDSGEVMPWEGPLETIATSLQGPVVRAVGIILIVIFGLGMAAGQGGGGMRTVLQIGFGLSLAAAAVSFGLPLLGFGLSL